MRVLSVYKILLNGINNDVNLVHFYGVKHHKNQNNKLFCIYTSLLFVYKMRRGTCLHYEISWRDLLLRRVIYMSQTWNILKRIRTDQSGHLVFSAGDSHWGCIIACVQGNHQRTIYYRLSLYRGRVLHDIEHNTKRRKLEFCSDYEPRKDAPKLALTGELWVSFLSSWGKGYWERAASYRKQRLFSSYNLFINVTSYKNIVSCS